LKKKKKETNQIPRETVTIRERGKKKGIFVLDGKKKKNKGKKQINTRSPRAGQGKEKSVLRFGWRESQIECFKGGKKKENHKENGEKRLTQRGGRASLPRLPKEEREGTFGLREK